MSAVPFKFVTRMYRYFFTSPVNANEINDHVSTENGSLFNAANSTCDLTIPHSKSIPNEFLIGTIDERSLAKVKELVKSGNGSSLLCSAIKLNRIDIVKFLLQEGVEVNRDDDKTDTPLHFAVEQGCEDTVRLLVERNAQIDALNALDETPLHLAAKSGYIKVVELLLTNSANTNAITSKGSTPLLLAAEWSHTDVCEVLLERGACVNVKDEANNTPLSFAVERKNSLLVSHLLQYSPLFDDKTHKSVLHIVVHDGPQNDIVEGLINHGFTLTREDMSCYNLLPVTVIKGYTKLVECLLDYGTGAVSNISLLQYAVGMGHKEIVKLFLNAGCEVRGTSIIDYVPVYCSEDSRKRDNVEIIQLLLAKGADAGEAPTFLHKAVNEECIKVCEILLINGADVNALDEHGYTPLHVAVSKMYKQAGGKTEESIRGSIVKLLVRHGGDLNFKTKDGLAVIHRAALNRREDVIRILLESEARVDLDSRAEDDSTPMHVAAEQGYKELVEFLFNNEANVDLRQKDGSTPLLMAASGGHSEVVRLLVELGAGVDARTTTNETALHLAARKEHHEVLAVLINNGCDVNIKSNKNESVLSVITTIIRFSNRYYRFDALRGFHDYPTTKLLKMEAIKLKIAGLCVSEELVRIIEDGPDSMGDYWRQCKEELSRMNYTKCCQYTLRDILMGPNNPTLARDKSLVQTFESFDLSEFPFYRGLLLKHFRKSKQRIALLNEGQKLLRIILRISNVFNIKKSPALPDELLDKIVSYLSDEDLRYFNCFGEKLKTNFSLPSP